MANTGAGFSLSFNLTTRYIYNPSVSYSCILLTAWQTLKVVVFGAGSRTVFDKFRFARKGNTIYIDAHYNYSQDNTVRVVVDMPPTLGICPMTTNPNVSEYDGYFEVGPTFLA